MAWRRHGFERQAGSSTRGLYQVPRRSFMSFTIWTAQPACIYRQWIQDERETGLPLLTSSLGWCPASCRSVSQSSLSKAFQQDANLICLPPNGQLGHSFVLEPEIISPNGKVIRVVKFGKVFKVTAHVLNKRWHCVMVPQTDRQTERPEVQTDSIAYCPGKTNPLWIL